MRGSIVGAGTPFKLKAKEILLLCIVYYKLYITHYYPDKKKHTVKMGYMVNNEDLILHNRITVFRKLMKLKIIYE